MAIIVSLIVGIVYILLFWSFIKKKNELFLKSLLIFVVFYDFIFINMSYSLNSGLVFLLKSWQEYFFLITSLFLLSKLISKGSIKKSKDNFIFLLLVLLSLYGVLIGIAAGKSIFDIFLSWRSYFLPLFLVILIAKSNRLQNISFLRINRFILFLGIIVVGYSIVQFQSFNGSLSSLWFYQYFDTLIEGSIDKSYYNFLREGRLRATSVYVSPLIYSMMAGMFFLMAFYNLILKSGIVKKVPYLFLLVFFGYGLYLSNARIGLVMLGVGIICGMLVYLFPRVRLSIVLMVPLSAIILTFILLVFGIIGDLSALGRLKQYLDLLMFFNPVGYGLADGRVVTLYDSWYISVLFLFGVLAVFYIYIHFYLFNTSLDAVKMNHVSLSKKIMRFSTFSYAFSFIFIFAFQYTIGGPTLLMLYILIHLINVDTKHKLCNQIGT